MTKLILRLERLQDGEAATATLQKLSQLKDSIAPVIDQQKRTADLLELAEMADSDMEAELSAEAQRLRRGCRHG